MQIVNLGNEFFGETGADGDARSSRRSSASWTCSRWWLRGRRRRSSASAGSTALRTWPCWRATPRSTISIRHVDMPCAPGCVWDAIRARRELGRLADRQGSIHGKVAAW